jgi:hypothetical protein
LAEIPTTREEYYRELSALGVKTRRRLELRSEYYRTIAYIRWMPWRRDELLARARAIREAISILDEDIAYERELIARKVIVPPVAPVVGVLDSKTGLKIILLSREHRGSRVWLYDEERREYVQTVETIRVEYTASVETGGHESFIGELTGWTIIDGDQLSDIEGIVDELVDKTEDWFYRKFAPPPEGEAWFGGPIPKEAIKPDFTIQEREYGAKYEDGIQRYEMTVTGEIAKRMIMKKGIGFYANPAETRPKWRRVSVYVEYAHEDETLGVDHPPIGEEIDP